MINMIEDNFMVSQINDPSGMKQLDSDNRLKVKQQEIKGPFTDTLNLSNNVSLSSTSKQLDALKASLRDIPEINEARVLYFKAEIQSGNYQINSDQIAKNMLNNLETA